MNTSPDKNVEVVRQKLLDRSVFGLNKYGVTTERTDVDYQGWLNHLQEELMDASVYVEAAMQQQLNLYFISQNINNDYDTFDSAVVVASSEEEAKLITPVSLDCAMDLYNNNFEYATEHILSRWCKPVFVQVTYLGKAASHLKSGEVVCASFNAG